MNKILKRLVGLFIIGIGILNICNATNVNSLITIAYSGQVTLGANTTTNAIDLGSAPNKTLCITLSGNLGNNNYVNIGFYGNTTNVASDSQEYWYDQTGKTVCMYANKRYFNINNPKTTTPTIGYEAYFLNDLLNTTIPNQNCPTFELTQVYGNKTRTGFNKVFYQASKEQVTSNIYMQNGNLRVIANTNSTNYIEKSQINTAYCTGNNLCPQCEQCEQCQTCPTIDAQYCMDNYNLIPPAYCPICGTGDVNWSSLYINGTQYNSNEMIDIHTEDQMEIDVDYLNDTVDIDITYGQDENYLNAILSGTAMTPTKEDFATMLTNGMIAYAPYLFIGLLMIFTIGIIKKFFRG